MGVGDAPVACAPFNRTGVPRMGHCQKLVVAALAVVALTGACGGSKKDTTSGGASTSTMAAASSMTTAPGAADANAAGAEGACAVLRQANIETAVGMKMNAPAAG